MDFGGFNLLSIAAITAVMLLLRWRRVGMLTWAIAWTAAMYAFFKWGFVTPVPASVVKLYMGIVLLAVFAYVSSNRERLQATVLPLLRLILEPRYKLLLALVVALVPTLVALNVYRQMNVPLEAPAFGRTVHPAPPDGITVHEREIDLIRGDNPYRHLEQSDPEAFRAHVEDGRRVYYENCFYCHGDAMAGDGMFAYALNPIPSNFNDPGVIPMLTESFLFWRVAKGGPGLPAEGGPWDSAMPRWESFLSEEEMWNVILFLYDFNDYRPRALEVHE